MVRVNLRFCEFAGGRTDLLGIVGDWRAWALRSILGFAAIFGTFAWLKHKAAVERISRQVEQTRWSLLAAHCLAMAAFVGLSFPIFVDGISGRADLLGTSWFAAGISPIILGGLAFLPRAIWAGLVRATGYLWAYCVVGNVGGRWLWQDSNSC